MPSRSGSERLAELRRRAEARLRSAIGPRREVPAQDVSRLMGELEVHAVELELQNEELRATQVQLQDARDRYFQHYDLAPVGYLTLDREGTVLEANLQAARLLRRERGRLVGTVVMRSSSGNGTFPTLGTPRAPVVRTGTDPASSARRRPHGGRRPIAGGPMLQE